MGLFSYLKIPYHIVVKPARGKDHAARMEGFYAPQAASYDETRRRLLPGRQELWQSLEVPQGGIWVDMGGGTGANFEYLGPGIAALGQIWLVDLTASLLDIARRRTERRDWQNMTIVEADATKFRLPTGTADVVTFSYSLTLIPDWLDALENAWAMLKPGGLIGVVDFYVSRKYPAEGFARHRWFTRTFWPIWLAGANLSPSPDHVPFLHRRFEPIRFSEGLARVPYVPLLRVPYFIFVGRKAAAPG